MPSPVKLDSVLGTTPPDTHEGSKSIIGTLTATQVRTLNATPVTVISAPGSGKYIKVLSCHWWLDYGGTAYDAEVAGDTLGLRYTNGSGDAVVDVVPGNTIGSATADYHVVVFPPAIGTAEINPVENAAIVASIASSEWAAADADANGNSVLKYEIVYEVKRFTW